MLIQKSQQFDSALNPDDSTILDISLTGWETVDATNYNEMSKKIPRVTHGKNILVYFCWSLNYLSGCMLGAKCGFGQSTDHTVQSMDLRFVQPIHGLLLA